MCRRGRWFGHHSRQGDIDCRDMADRDSPNSRTKAPKPQGWDASREQPGAVTNAQTDSGSTRHSASPAGSAPDRNTPKSAVFEAGQLRDLGDLNQEGALHSRPCDVPQNTRGGIVLRGLRTRPSPRGCAPSGTARGRRTGQAQDHKESEGSDQGRKEVAAPGQGHRRSRKLGWAMPDATPSTGEEANGAKTAGRRAAKRATVAHVAASSACFGLPAHRWSEAGQW